MGLAASQARLLLLTARKSDLEYRAQCITNTEMILAMQTEAVARKYSEKISNQALFYRNANTNQSTALTSATFFSTIAGAGYSLEIRTGRNADGTGKYQPYKPDGSTICYIFTPDEDTTINGITYKKGESVSIGENVYNALTPEQQNEMCTIDTTNSNYNNDYNEIGLIEAINSGLLRVVQADGTPVSLSGNTAFTESYYTDDDAQAEAEYKRETAAIQVKEKRLQNDLQQVESQQKACETEMDSVKKVIEKNIEKTFKVFS